MLKSSKIQTQTTINIYNNQHITLVLQENKLRTKVIMADKIRSVWMAKSSMDHKTKEDILRN